MTPPLTLPEPVICLVAETRGECSGEDFFPLVLKGKDMNCVDRSFVEYAARTRLSKQSTFSLLSKGIFISSYEARMNTRLVFAASQNPLNSEPRILLIDQGAENIYISKLNNTYE